MKNKVQIIDIVLMFMIIYFTSDFERRCHVALGANGYERVTFERIFYQTEGSSVVEGNLNPIPIYLLKGKEITQNIECPAIAFVILPDEKAEHYGITKMLSHFKFGVVTQCIISPKYMGQRNDKSKDQFCGNLAIKVNAKLSNVMNQGRCWTTQFDGREGVPWICEAPTFVIGISISNTLGNNAVSMIAASTCLDSTCMRFAQDIRIQSKTEVIDEAILVDITKSLLHQYYTHNKKLPERVLVYRGK